MARATLDVNVLVSAVISRLGIPHKIVVAVTGDAGLLALGMHEDIRVVTPRRFLDLLEY